MNPQTGRGPAVARAAAVAATFLAAAATSVAPASAIYNGTDANLSDHAYMVSIRVASTPDVHICGGTLISPKLVLTAAHCVVTEDGTAEPVVAVVGVDVPGWETAPRVKVIDQVSGPFPDGTKNAGDVAVLLLDEEQTTMTARLTTQEPAVGTNATALGWGYTDKPNFEGEAQPGPLPDTLQQLEMKIAKDSECLKMMSFLDNATSLCATSTRSTTRNADSGGPLMVRNKATGEFTQVGLLSTSWGNKAGTKFASSFISVPEKASWIASAREKLERLKIRSRSFDARVGEKFSANLNEEVWRGTNPVSWRMLSAPAGWTLSPEGLLSAAPTASGPVTLQVEGIDANDYVAQATYEVMVDPAAPGGYQIGTSLVVNLEEGGTWQLNSSATLIGAQELMFDDGAGSAFLIGEVDSRCVGASSVAACVAAFGTQEQIRPGPGPISIGGRLTDSSAYLDSLLGTELNMTVWCRSAEHVCVITEQSPGVTVASQSVLDAVTWLK